MATRGGRGMPAVRGQQQPVWVQGQQGQWRMRNPQPGAIRNIVPTNIVPTTPPVSTPTSEPQIVGLVPNQASSPAAATAPIASSSSSSDLPTANQAMEQLREEARTSAASNIVTVTPSNGSGSDASPSDLPDMSSIVNPQSATAAGRTLVDRESSDSESTGRQSASSHHSQSPGYQQGNRILNIEPLSFSSTLGDITNSSDSLGADISATTTSSQQVS